MAKLLLIDDDAKMRTMIARMLSPPYEIVQATNGREGMELFMEHRPALVITDIMMPEKDGIETIRDIRKIDPQVGVIAISGSSFQDGNPDFLKFAAEFGADAIVAKPFRAKQMIDAVNRALAPRGA